MSLAKQTPPCGGFWMPGSSPGMTCFEGWERRTPHIVKTTALWLSRMTALVLTVKVETI